MHDKAKTESKHGKSKSGMFPRPAFTEGEARREPPPPPPKHLPGKFDGGATTGSMPVVTEGEDHSAERDNDRA